MSNKDDANRHSAGRITQMLVGCLPACTRAAYAVYISVLGREPVPMIIEYKNTINEYEA